MDNQYRGTVSPFGNPDGARAELEEITRGFILFGNASRWGGLSTAPNDLTARVLVGRKGSGKTVYLRRLRASAALEKSLYADQIHQDLPTTQNVIKFCHWFPSDILTEQWQEMWRKAIVRSVVSHILCNPALNSYVSPVQKGRILTDFADIIRPGEKAFTAHVSIYSQVNEIVNSNYSRKEIDKYFNRPGWAELETVVSETIATCPPLCFYLDAVDEEFGHAPMYWLRAQKGLFYQVMRFLRDAQLGSRLHIVIGMRDIVLASVYRSEHQTRYRGEPHIRVLSWDKKAIEYFLHEKLAKLDEHFFIGGLSTGRTLTNWLGMSEVTNVQRNVNEPIMQYLLRHTRLLPRDIVTLGNLLCRSISEMQAQPSRSDKQLLVRKTVSEAARVFGNEQLAICANELASAAMPAHAVDHGYAETYTANQEYIRGIAEDLKNVISYIGIDRFSFERLREAQKFAEDRFEEGTDPLSVLWMNGLLGYVDGGRGAERHVFYSDDRMDEFHLPLNRQEYILHPILIDSVGVGISEGKPIVPFDGE